MNELIFVEFSLSQKAFHKHNIVDMIQRNLESIVFRKQSDYIPVGYFTSDKYADDFIASNYDSFKNYSMYQSTGGDTLICE